MRRVGEPNQVSPEQFHQVDFVPKPKQISNAASSQLKETYLWRLWSETLTKTRCVSAGGPAGPDSSGLGWSGSPLAGGCCGSDEHLRL